VVDECPVIDVDSPANAVEHGAPITFTASVGGGDAAVQYTFRWTVSAGTITNGQGTSSITVDTVGLGGVEVKATAEVGGFPEPCPNSDTTAVVVRPVNMCCHSMDRYGDISFRDEQARLDNFAIALQNERGAKGYIVAYDGRRARPYEARNRANRAKRYIVNRLGLEAGRIFIIDGGHHEAMTFVLYIVPDGQTAPRGVPTVDPSEVRIIRDTSRRGRRRRGE
jgi:hypothetical protein